MFSLSDTTRRRVGNENGFSLVEAMIAIFIFVVGILGAYKLQLHATQGNALANRVSTSTTWAAYTVEEIVGKDYEHSWLDDDGADGVAGLDDIGANADGAIYIQKNGDKTTAPSGDDLYSIFWNVAEGTGPGGEASLLRDVKQIRVRVFRNGGIGNGNLYNHDYYRAKWPESE